MNFFITIPTLFLVITSEVSPIPSLQIMGIPILSTSACLVGDEAFLEKTGLIKNIEIHDKLSKTGTSSLLAFTNNQVYCLPSCITACHTFMNIDYKYFAGTNDPIEIINKYRMRGFGTYLNDDEKVKLIDYSYKVNKWKK